MAATAVGIAALCLLVTACVPAATTPPPAAPTSAASPPAASNPAPSTAVATPATSPPAASASFAIIGDYGTGDSHEAAVAQLVASWNPDFIIAVGDDYYAPAGGKGTGRYDESTGAYYCRWLKDLTTSGRHCPSGQAPENAFFPAMGNHDYSDATPGPRSYLTYFALPGAGVPDTSGNERYYEFVEGRAHFFVLNSNPEEPDGTSSTARQAQWLKAQLAGSTSRWNIVYDHHPPYSSDATHGSTTDLRWPFARWGADAVISGHSHTYERIMRDGIVYFVNGLGGAPRYSFGRPVAGSKVRYDANWGAQRVTATPTTMEFAFYNVAGERVDSYTVAAR